MSGAAYLYCPVCFHTMDRDLFRIFHMRATLHAHHVVNRLLSSVRLPSFKFLQAAPRCGRSDPLVVTGQVAKRAVLVIASELSRLQDPNCAKRVVLVFTFCIAGAVQTP